MKILAIANQKGGTAKTATAHALGVVLASQGLRVCLIDTDPQASLTQAAGVGDVAGRSLAEVLGGSSPGRLAIGDVLQDLGGGLYLAPADIALAACELGLTSRLGRESVLRKALQPLAGRFDVTIVDCPPSLGLLTVGALVAAGGVIIPTQPQAADLRGVRLFLDTLEIVRNELNPDLQTLGVLATFYDPRLIHHRQALETMRTAGLPLLPVTIGRSVRVAEAAGAGQSVITYSPENPQAAAYIQLAELVKQWLKSKGQQA